MRINSSAMLQQTSQSSLVQKKLSSIMQKLSTGLQINSAADDPANAAVAQQLDSMARGYKTSEDNISDAQGALNIADGASSSINSILQSQRDLAVQASSDTLNPQDRKILDQQYQSLNQELSATANGTQYNGMDLLNGQSQLSDGNGTIQTGVSANASSQTPIPQMNLTPGTIGDGGSIATSAGAKAALNTIDNAMKNVQSQQANIGATQNSLSYADSLSSVMEINTTSALSNTEDMDYAQGLMDLASANIQNQSSLTAISNFNQISQNSIMALLQ